MKNKILGYVFLGLVFAAVVGAVYYWEYVQDSKQESENSKQTQNTYDETVDWKTYSSGKYTFSFKYPPHWNPDFDEDRFVYKSISPDAGTEDFGVSWENGTVEDYIALLKKSLYSKSPRYAITETDLTLDGVKAKKLRYSNKMYSSQEVLIPIHGGYLKFSGGLVYTSFDQVISTFKFVK